MRTERRSIEAKGLPLTRSGLVTNDLKQVLTAYESWLLRQPIAKNTQDAYRFHVRKFWEYLATRPTNGDDPLLDPFARDYAVRDYKTYLKTEHKAKPSSVNLALAAMRQLRSLLIFISALSFSESWWARYAPQVWLLPLVTAVIGLLITRGLWRGLRWGRG